ncbi:MAG: elongation factor P [Candidatus Omnitrophica bacterium]|nr:elongation factor P [Candidatus Omnitrophota bacterium]
MIGANELKRNAIIMVNGQPYQVLEVFFATPSARGASTMVRTKIRHLLNATVQDKTFKTSEKFDEADIEIVLASFLYKEGQDYYFMDQTTFEIAAIPDSLVGESAGFLREQLEVKITKYNSSPVSLELPLYVNLKVVEAEPGNQHAGSAGAGTKSAVLETGRAIRVPTHISAGEIVRVNTETGEFIGRAQGEKQL